MERALFDADVLSPRPKVGFMFQNSAFTSERRSPREGEEGLWYAETIKRSREPSLGESCPFWSPIAGYDDDDATSR